MCLLKFFCSWTTHRNIFQAKLCRRQFVLCFCHQTQHLWSIKWIRVFLKLPRAVICPKHLTRWLIILIARIKFLWKIFGRTIASKMLSLTLLAYVAKVTRSCMKRTLKRSALSFLRLVSFILMTSFQIWDIKSHVWQDLLDLRM